MQPKNQEKNCNIDLLVETSWEVCNKIGGIYTVLSTKARVLQEKFGDKLVFIGPDTSNGKEDNSYFIEDPDILNGFSQKSLLPFGINVRSGRWNIPGSPQVLLVSFNEVYKELDKVFGLMWEQFGVNSLNEYGDYREGCAFSVASAITCYHLSSFLKVEGKNVIMHFNEWTTGMGLLYLRHIFPKAASIFTTHATSIGRSICGNGKPLYDYFYGYNGDQMARELNMEAKHSLEKTAAYYSDCFTAVSEITAKECEQLLEKSPDVVTPNGFEPDFVPGEKKYSDLRTKGREKIIKIASALKNKVFPEDIFIVATSGRNEYHNKGIDIFLDSLKELEKKNPEKQLIALILVPAWVKEPSSGLLKKLNNRQEEESFPNYLTHRLNNEEVDLISCRIKALEEEGEIGNNINVIYVPCYLKGGDGIINISYYDILPAIDLTVFPSYYEPWGYTPLESIAFGVPTITSDKSGFGQWILSNFINSFESCGVKVIGRTDSNYMDFADEAAGQINSVVGFTDEEKEMISLKAKRTAEKADWKYFLKYYEEAFEIALNKRDQRLEKSKYQF